MKNYVILTGILAFALAMALPGVAAVNEDSVGVSCQFLDSSGDPITGANVVVSIYDASTGGSQLYSETFNSATDSNGVCTFNTLASASTLPLTEGQEYFLDLTVNGNDYDFDGIERQAFIAWFGQNKQISGNMTVDTLTADVLSGTLSGVVTGTGTAGGSVELGTGASAGLLAVGIGNDATASSNAVAIGDNADATSFRAVAIGRFADATADNAIAIGEQTFVTAENAVQIGSGDNVNQNDQPNSFEFISGSNDIFRVNMTGVYDTTGKLATESYVQANAGGGSVAGTDGAIQYNDGGTLNGSVRTKYNSNFDGYVDGLEGENATIGFYDAGSGEYDGLALVSDADNNYNALYIDPIYGASLENYATGVNAKIELIDYSNTFRFRTGGDPAYTDLNFTNGNGGQVVFPASGNLATEAYVQANAGGGSVNTSADYNWTGTHQFTDGNNQFNGEQFTLNNGVTLTDDNDCLYVTSPDGSNTAEVCNGGFGVEKSEYVWSSQTTLSLSAQTGNIDTYDIVDGDVLGGTADNVTSIVVKVDGRRIPIGSGVQIGPNDDIAVDVLDDRGTSGSIQVVLDASVAGSAYSTTGVIWMDGSEYRQVDFAVTTPS